MCVNTAETSNITQHSKHNYSFHQPTNLHSWVAGRLNSALKVSVVALTALHVVEVRDEHGHLKGGLSGGGGLKVWLLQLSNLLQGIRVSRVSNEPVAVC